MPLTSYRSSRKPSGGIYHSSRKKRIYEIQNPPVMTKLGERKVRSVRVSGGYVKLKLLSDQLVVVYDPKTKKYSKEKIKTIVENTANRHFVRRNIITKGAVVETEKGKVKITSRPGQVGYLQGILLF